MQPYNFLGCLCIATGHEMGENVMNAMQDILHALHNFTNITILCVCVFIGWTSSSNNHIK